MELNDLYSPGTKLREVDPNFRGMDRKRWQLLKVTEQGREHLAALNANDAPIKRLTVEKDGAIGRVKMDNQSRRNAMTLTMWQDLGKAIEDFAADDSVRVIIISGEGGKAFCAGADISEFEKNRSSEEGVKIYNEAVEHSSELLRTVDKPTIAKIEGFCVGGGVGIGCHASHRIVGESSQIAMPECGIGLIPDVGGSLMLARAPGRLGEYLGTTGARMDAGNAIYAGFADSYVPKEKWDALTAALVNGGDVSVVDAFVQDAPESSMHAQQVDIDRHFDALDLSDVAVSLASDPSEFAAQTLKMISKKSPLSVVATPALIARVRAADTIEQALAEEYKFTYRAAEFGDFVEGIKATIIDRNHTPNWRFATLADVSQTDVNEMLAPLGANAL